MFDTATIMAETRVRIGKVIDDATQVIDDMQALYNLLDQKPAPNPVEAQPQPLVVVGCPTLQKAREIPTSIYIPVNDGSRVHTRARADRKKLWPVFASNHTNPAPMKLSMIAKLFDVPQSSVSKYYREWMVENKFF